MNKKLVITLKSDLCAAMGDGFSLGVDIDVCLDEHGFPFIPGRRIKGCLREAAVEIGCNALAEIFGVPGSGTPGCIRVGNAVVRGSRNLKEIAAVRGFNASSVSALYTQVRAQTAVEGDSVKDGSLRFMRVVGHYDPIGQEELVFEAVISFEDEYEAQIERAAKALRNMGYRRNRGFGAVRCALVDAIEDETPATSVKAFSHGFAYAVKLDDPLMIPSQGDCSFTYIPGASVLGFFAGKLKKSLSDEEFENIFLKDEVRFSPLYPVSQGNRSLPAFGLIAKIKGAKEGARDGDMVNLRACKLEEGEQPKPLKNGFLDACSYSPGDVRTEIVYHHSTGAATGDDPTLYTQECISAGQVLAGFVTGPDDILEKLKSVLADNALSFGRSKTAQYSRCSLIDYEGSVPSGDVVTVNGAVVALLDSDVLLDNGCGAYSSDPCELRDAIAGALGLSSDAADVRYCSVKYRTISGYNAKWNQKKPHVRAFAAGSYFVFDGAEFVPQEIFLGERLGEGFGRVIVVPADSVVPRKCEAVGNNTVPKDDDEIAQKWQALLDQNDLREKLRSVALTCADDAMEKGFNTAFVGRVLRMIEQAENRDDLNGRIGSIKTEAKRSSVQAIIKNARVLFGEVSWEQEQEALGMLFNCVKYRTKAKGGNDE